MRYSIAAVTIFGCLCVGAAGAAAAGDGTGFLVVYALVDTGDTIRAVRARLPLAHYACVYAKPAGRDSIDTYITEVSQDTWILFPWDTEPQFVAPLAKRRP